MKKQSTPVNASNSDEQACPFTITPSCDTHTKFAIPSVLNVTVIVKMSLRCEYFTARREFVSSMFPYTSKLHKNRNESPTRTANSARTRSISKTTCDTRTRTDDTRASPIEAAAFYRTSNRPREECARSAY